MAVDYAALAKQARGSSAPPVDYAAIAAQARGEGKVTPQSPGLMERINSRLPTAGITDIPGAIRDIAKSPNPYGAEIGRAHV